MPRSNPNKRLKEDLTATCSRCGRHYVIDAKLGQYRSFAVNARSIFGQYGQTYFLCPECMRKFYQWINGL